MLDVMRRNAQSWLIKGIFAIIIVVFILFWTEPGQKGIGLEVVATVDGSKITLTEYRRSYDNLMNIYRSVYREGLSEEIIKMLKLKEKALDSIIDSRLLLKEADNLGLSVSNAELAESISRYPAFQKDEAFDKGLYLAVLKANRLTAEEFEEGQRRNLLVGKVEGLIKEGVRVSDDEVKGAYAGQIKKPKGSGAGKPELKAEEDAIRTGLAQQKGEEALKSWLKMARTKAKTKIYDEFLQ